MASDFRAFLEQLQARAPIEKDQPTGPDVHLSTALGNERPTSFKAIRRRRRQQTTETTEQPVGKADGAWSLRVQISKTDADQNLVFGWGQVIAEDGKDPAELDTQGDIVDEATLEKAFYGFAEDARRTGEMHAGGPLGQMVECMVFTKAKQAALGIDLKKVGAWVGFRVPPETFAKVKDGTYPAFSIQGVGRRVRV